MAVNWVDGTTLVNATNLNALEDEVATAQNTADSNLSIVDFSDAITIEDDVDASVVFAYKIGRIGFVMLMISNTTTSSLDIATITNSAYRPYKMIFGSYATLSASYANALMFSRIQTGGTIQARFTMATSGSYISYVYPLIV